MRVVAPAVIAEDLAARGWDWLDAVAWEGDGSVPEEARSAVLWVPPYGVTHSPELARTALDAMAALQVVQLQSAGVEPWDTLVPPGVRLCSGRGVHGGSTAELAVALVLASVRDLAGYVEQQRQHRWQRLSSGSLAGRCVLVLGAGDIGRRAAAVLASLECDVVLVGRRSRAGVLTWEEAQARLGSTDVLLVAVPRTPDTEHLVDARVLAALPDGALVVNVARGPVVDTAALTAEVASGRLRAALDVTDPEPLPEGHPLWSLPGSLVTPHVGGGTEGWEERARALVADQVERLHTGRDLRNLVTDGY